MPELTEQPPARGGVADTSWTQEGCDRCGLSAITSGVYVAQAWFRFTLPSGLQLTMCAHHGHEAVAQMVAFGAIVEDLTAHLG